MSIVCWNWSGGIWMRKTAVETTHSSFLSNKLPATNLQHRKLTISLTQAVQLFFFRSITVKINYYVRHVDSSFRPSAWNNSAYSGWIFIKYHMSVFRKPVKKIKVSLKHAKNSGYVTWRPVYMYDNISPNSSQNEKFFRQILYRESKYILCSIISFSKFKPFMR
jgi:hypothetical protein